MLLNQMLNNLGLCFMCLMLFAFIDIHTMLFSKFSIHEGEEKVLYPGPCVLKWLYLTVCSTVFCAHACLLQKPVLKEENEDEIYVMIL